METAILALWAAPFVIVAIGAVVAVATAIHTVLTDKPSATRW